MLLTGLWPGVQILVGGRRQAANRQRFHTSVNNWYNTRVTYIEDLRYAEMMCFREFLPPKCFVVDGDTVIGASKFADASLKGCSLQDNFGKPKFMRRLRFNKPFTT